jgi:hypothetical protein
MIEREVSVPKGLDPARVEHTVAACCAADDLRNTLKGTLARYPGSVHWHYSQPRERGTLEITWWPRGERLWFKVSAGRSARWITARLPALQQALEMALSALAPAAASLER